MAARRYNIFYTQGGTPERLDVQRKLAKNLEISLLYDFYGELLTEKQQEVIEFYYNQDLSLAEIAVHSGITRQGVRDCIKRAEFSLLEFERLLGLAKKFGQIRNSLDAIAEKAAEIDRVNSRLGDTKEISDRVRDITRLTREIAAT
jgi:predicted DNA-binding protein YlxM (UPF0122 family)